MQQDLEDDTTRQPATAALNKVRKERQLTTDKTDKQMSAAAGHTRQHLLPCVEGWTMGGSTVGGMVTSTAQQM